MFSININILHLSKKAKGSFEHLTSNSIDCFKRVINIRNTNIFLYSLVSAALIEFQQILDSFGNVIEIYERTFY